MTDPMNEPLELLKRTHAWIDGLTTSGMTEAAAVTAILGALVERLLRAGGVEEAATYLEKQAALMRTLGPDMLAELHVRRH